VRHGGPVGLVVFDLDHFKRVNDGHGHLAGDAVLVGLTRRFRPRIRREDIFARIGGEEFAVVLADTGQEGAMAFAESLRALCERDPFVHEGTPIKVTISLGVASLEGRERADANELIRAADEKLYQAKNGGRNRVVG
jgi:diguanylate cyclase (GGDEF)-like protein